MLSMCPALLNWVWPTPRRDASNYYIYYQNAQREIEAQRRALEWRIQDNHYLLGKAHKLWGLADARGRELDGVKRENTNLQGQITQLRESNEAQRRGLDDSHQKNECLQSEAQKLRQGHLENTEKIRRQQGLLSKARTDALDIEKHHHEELTELCNKINALQNGQAAVSDEQVIDKMRKLGQNLDRWVTSNFKDAQRLAAFVAKPEVEFPRTPSQKRASIQASIAVLISRRIFAPYYFGVADEGGKIFADIEESVGQTCSEGTLQHWRFATSVAIDCLATDSRKTALSNMITYVETQFGQYSSTEPERRKQQLGDLLQRCSDLKSTLCSQQDKYDFRCSPFGAWFDSSSMTFAGGDGQSDIKVRLCLWPALGKSSPGVDLLVLEPELVWTMELEKTEPSPEGCVVDLLD